MARCKACSLFSIGGGGLEGRDGVLLDVPGVGESPKARSGRVCAVCNWGTADSAVIALPRLDGRSSFLDQSSLPCMLPGLDDKEEIPVP